MFKFNKPLVLLGTVFENVMWWVHFFVLYIIKYKMRFVGKRIISGTVEPIWLISFNVGYGLIFFMERKCKEAGRKRISRQNYFWRVS